MEYKVLLMIHRKEYALAAKYMEETITHKRFDQQSGSRKESWKILQAYMYLLQKAGKLTLENSEGRLSRFRMKKFLNEVSIFIGDKSGYNVSIIIAQLTELIIDDKLEQLTDKLEAVTRYQSRYLSHEHLYRSSIFLNMILSIAKLDKNLNEIRKYGQEKLKQMKQISFKYSDEIDGSEIIPFPDLWQIICESLEQNYNTL
jgi:hypothetical protein